VNATTPISTTTAMSTSFLIIDPRLSRSTAQRSVRLGQDRTGLRWLGRGPVESGPGAIRSNSGGESLGYQPEASRIQDGRPAPARPRLAGRL
jgi:hypothetical protein